VGGTVNDDSEKAFDATPQRIERAKREGNVARSSEVSGNFAFAAAALAVTATAPLHYSAAHQAFTVAASGAAPWAETLVILSLAVVPVGAAAAAGMAASLIQAGGIRVSSVGPKAERLSPGEGLKRMLSRETLSHAVRAAAAFSVATVATIPSFSSVASGLIAATTASSAAACVWHAVEHITFAAGATGLLFALAEYGAARNAWLRKLRMSFDERKREAKEQDGDPLARSRRRTLHRSLLRGAISKVKEASFVVANPNHVAIALQYRPPGIAVPLVLVRASGEAALRVRALAIVHRIPVIEDVSLARALFRDARVGHPIGCAHYVAVAEIVVALTRSKPAS
jgi:flagellar biosynthetic protein FlhB